VSFRPILGATEDLAWQRARNTLEQVQGATNGGAQAMRRDFGRELIPRVRDEVRRREAQGDAAREASAPDRSDELGR
jgi:hypothetical protein